MANAVLFEDSTLNEKAKMVFSATEKKLGQYYAPETYGESRTRHFTQQGLSLLKAVRAFDPAKAAFLRSAAEDLSALPGFNDEVKVQFTIFQQRSDEFAEEGVGIIRLWKTLDKRFPELSKLALRYLSVPSGSADAERSFSARGNIVTHQRRALTLENRRKHTFLYINSKR